MPTQKTQVAPTVAPTVAPSAMSYTALIIKAGEKHMTLKSIRLSILKDIKKKGVKFSDIEKYLLNQFRKDGFYSNEEDLATADKEDASWFHHLQLFLGWIDRNYVDYDKDKAGAHETRKARVVAESKKATKVRVATVTDKRAGELMDNPEALKILLKALESKGYLVGDEVSIIGQLEEKGYLVTKED